MTLTGIHHITAICSDPQSNVDFYAKLLGLRLVKVTVNFDDPGSYHLYYGDELGSPGSCMTFFAWPTAFRGKTGTGHATSVAYSVPPGSLLWWKDRLAAARVSVEDAGQGLLSFSDPDGILLKLVECQDERKPWLGEGIGAEFAIRGFHSVGASVSRLSETISAIEALGFSKATEHPNRYVVNEGLPGQIVDFVESNVKATQGVGTIHHIAFAIPDDAGQEASIDELFALGLHPTKVQDRQYFHSIYFREPSGVLYEIATNGPGFAVDEPIEALGQRLCLPDWFEKRRDQIEKALPKIVVRSGKVVP